MLDTGDDRSRHKRELKRYLTDAGYHFGWNPIRWLAVDAAEQEHQLRSRRRLDTSLAIVLACSRLDARRVIDLGCSSGSLLRYLAAHCPETEFVGVDRDVAWITRNLTVPGPRNCAWLTWDYTTHPPTPLGTFDLLYSVFGLEWDVERDGAWADTTAGIRDSERYATVRTRVCRQLRNWSTIANPGAELLVLAHIPSGDRAVAVIDEAASRGWCWSPSRSSKIVSGGVILPLLRFVRERPVEYTPDEIIAWWY